MGTRLHPDGRGDGFQAAAGVTQKKDRISRLRVCAEAIASQPFRIEF